MAVIPEGKAVMYKPGIERVVEVAKVPQWEKKGYVRLTEADIRKMAETDKK